MEMSPFGSQHYVLPTTTKQPQNSKHGIRIEIIVVVSAFCPYAVLLVAVNNFLICRVCCFQYAQWMTQRIFWNARFRRLCRVVRKL